MVRPDPSLSDVLGARYHSVQVEVPVRLNTNESPFGPLPGLAEALGALADVDLARYPDRRAQELRERIGALHGVGPDAVFVANGSNEVLQTLLVAWGGPGRRAWVAEPTYGMYRQIARATRTDVVAGSRTPDGAIDPASFAAGGEIVLLCQPNNPTGQLEPPAVLEAALGLDGRLVVLDEAYADFAGLGPATLLGEHVVRVRTFSKAFGLAGLRLGYAVAAPQVVEVLFASCLPYHVNALTQRLALWALAQHEEVERRAARLVAERERVARALGELVARVWPSATNFVLFEPGKPARAVWEGLLARGVLVRDASGWPGLGDVLRVTIGTPAENDTFLVALAEVLR